MTVGAAIFMDGTDHIPAVTGNAEGGRSHTGGVTVGVTSEIGGMAVSAGAAPNRRDVIPAGRDGESRRRGVTQVAGILMHSHWAIGRVASGRGNTGRGIDDMA